MFAKENHLHCQVISQGNIPPIEMVIDGEKVSRRYTLSSKLQ
ncbi:hypothetical protein O9993_01080 [Vibrio lentus]|nr:hypothetical protein [Vibrio lentus]